MTTTEIDLITELVKPEPPAGQGIESQKVVHRFLRLRLSANVSGLLPLAHLIEVSRISLNEILPVPQLPPHLLGIGSWRGAAVWLVDLGSLVGSPHITQRLSPSQTSPVVVLAGGDPGLAVLVEQVLTIDTFDPQELRPYAAGMAAAQLLAFCQGYFVAPNGELLYLFDPEAIIAQTVSS